AVLAPPRDVQKQVQLGRRGNVVQTHGPLSVNDQPQADVAPGIGAAQAQQARTQVVVTRQFYPPAVLREAGQAAVGAFLDVFRTARRQPSMQPIPKTAHGNGTAQYLFDERVGVGGRLCRAVAARQQGSSRLHV